MDRFQTSKEELQLLGSEFHAQAFTLIDDLFNLSFWLLLNRRSAKKIIKDVYKKAIYYCDKTKADTDWHTWMHRILFNRVFDHYDKHKSEPVFNFESIDSWDIEPASVVELKEKSSNQTSGKKIIELLRKIPPLLLTSLILKDVYSLSYQSAAEFIDVPDPIIPTRIYRARKLLFMLLTKEINDTKLEIQKQKGEKLYNIKELRQIACLTDNEQTEKNENSLESDMILKLENEVQKQIKFLIQNSVNRKQAPAYLKRKIKKWASERFFIQK